jgi:prepilin-type processing-associated H-X9-DG protein
MKLTAFPKTIFCLALLLGWGSCVPSATAQCNKCWIELNSVTFPQTVEVETPRGDYTAVFQSEVQVFPNHEARGFLTLIPTDSAPRHQNGANFAFSDGHVKWSKNGTVAGVLLKGYSEDGNPVVVMITPAASEDCLIYTTVGTDVHATWEAQGRLAVIR